MDQVGIVMLWQDGLVRLMGQALCHLDWAVRGTFELVRLEGLGAGDGQYKGPGAGAGQTGGHGGLRLDLLSQAGTMVGCVELVGIFLVYLQEHSVNTIVW